jgi:nucleotide-binding universal stress UspA family protein
VSGTIVCGVEESAEGVDALRLAAALSRRLGQRLVLVHLRTGKRGEGSLIYKLGGELDLEETVEIREGVGDSAQALARVAADEGADLIMLWSRRSRFRRHSVECKLALELEAVTAIPVVIAPPQTLRPSGRRLDV